MRSWRESHLSEIRHYQQAIPQAFPQVSGQIAPVTSAQLPWLAGLAASSCNDSVHIIECNYSLAEGLSEMFKMLIEGKLVKTNYVVIICACRNRTIDSCIAVTGELLRKNMEYSSVFVTLIPTVVFCPNWGQQLMGSKIYFTTWCMQKQNILYLVDF